MSSKYIPKKQNISGNGNRKSPNLENPRQALDAIMGTSVDFLDGKLKFTIGAHVVITRLNLMDGIGEESFDFAKFCSLIYALYDDGNKNRIYDVFRSAQKGIDEYEIEAMRWAEEKGICFSNLDDVANILSEFMTKLQDAQTKYESENKGGRSGNE